MRRPSTPLGIRAVFFELWKARDRAGRCSGARLRLFADFRHEIWLTMSHQHRSFHGRLLLLIATLVLVRLDGAALSERSTTQRSRGPTGAEVDLHSPAARAGSAATLCCDRRCRGADTREWPSCRHTPGQRPRCHNAHGLVPDGFCRRSSRQIGTCSLSRAPDIWRHEKMDRARVLAQAP